MEELMSESQIVWRELYAMLHTIQLEFNVLEGENVRLTAEVDALRMELNHLRNENVILRSDT
jgi:hypothetical protein